MIVTFATVQRTGIFSISVLFSSLAATIIEEWNSIDFPPAFLCDFY